MLKQIKNSLKELGFSANEIKVYLALTQLGEAKAAQIAKKTDLPRTTVISLLEKLELQNLVTTNKYRGTTYYWIESPKTIVETFENQLLIANKLNDQLIDLYRSDSHFPTATIFDTKTGIKQFINKTISSLTKKSVIKTIDCPGAGNYTKIYTNEYRKLLYRQKKSKQIITHTLIPVGHFKQIDAFKLKEQDILIKELPKELNYTASLWLLKDQLFHFSGNPPFITAIQHEQIVKSQNNLFDYLWSISKKIN